MIRKPPREPEIDRRIASGDLPWLIAQVEHGPCACFGPEDGEPFCPCKMTSKAVRDRVSYAALKRGKIVPLKP